MDCQVLIAVDHQSIRRGLQLLLQSAGFEVCTETIPAASVAEKIRALLPQVAVISIDDGMLRGLEVIREIKRTAPATKVVVFTAHAPDVLERDALRMGASAVAGPESDVVAMVSQAMEGK